MLFIFLQVQKSFRDRYMFKTAFLQKNVNNLETLQDRFFSNFYICKFEVNRDGRTRYAKSWSNLTLKCNANTFVKVDAQIEENGQRTISDLKGYSCPKIQLQENE